MQTMMKHLFVPRPLRMIAVAAMAFLPSGCVLPPIIAAISASTEVASYAATGKSLPDQAYSSMTDQDCAALRVFGDEPVCRAKSPAVAPVALSRETYVTIGNFFDRDRAEQIQSHFVEYHPAIVAVTIGGEAYNRVVAGPLTADEAAHLRSEMTFG
jgi:hypothetical protein